MSAQDAVTIEGVSYAYPGAAAPAIENVSMRIAVGERLGVLGPNGGGKSTLMRLILGLATPTSGEVRVFGERPARARRRSMVGYVPQRVTSELGFPLTAWQVARMPSEVRAGRFRRVEGSADDHLRRVFELVGATSFAGSRIGELSGGQLQRVMIARALSAGPRLLLLDEPTVGIDIEVQRRFAEMLSLVAKELDLTVVTVSHDLRTVALASDRVACLRRTLHYHDAPGGLTPRVLAELFQHDIEAVFGEASSTQAHGHGHADGGGCAHD